MVARRKSIAKDENILSPVHSSSSNVDLHRSPRYAHRDQVESGGGPEIIVDSESDEEDDTDSSSSEDESPSSPAYDPSITHGQATKGSAEPVRSPEVIVSDDQEQQQQLLQPRSPTQRKLIRINPARYSSIVESPSLTPPPSAALPPIPTSPTGRDSQAFTQSHPPSSYSGAPSSASIKKKSSVRAKGADAPPTPRQPPTASNDDIESSPTMAFPSPPGDFVQDARRIVAAHAQAQAPDDVEQAASESDSSFVQPSPRSVRFPPQEAVHIDAPSSHSVKGRSSSASAPSMRKSHARSDPRPAADLAHWAPTGQTPVPSTLPHLPDWRAADAIQTGEHNRGNGVGLSSLPNGHIQRDIDYTMRKLMNERVFADLVMDPLGRHRFREYLAAEGDTSEIDLWFDAYNYSRLIEDVRVNGEALHDIYIAEGSEAQVQLPQEIRREVLASLRKLVSLDASFESTQRHLLHKMYHHEFQRFVKHKIIQETQVKLGKHNLSEQDQEGLGDCFCLTNPRLMDHPIVLVSDGFVGVSGYPKSQIVGRNCRFLQGPGTAPESVQRIRNGLNSGEGCTELLLNYRRNGEPFYCLLCIIPLRDATGSIAYFIGGQTNVTGLLANEKNLGFLIGGDSGSAPLAQASGPQSMQLSPTMAFYKELAGNPSNTNVTTHSLQSHGPRSAAAGALDPLSLGRPSGTANLAPGPSRPSGAGFFRALFNRSSAGGGIGGIEGRQVLAGAEATLNGEARPLEDQLSLFQDTYSKIIIFKQAKREITFVTRHMLGYFGLPCSTAHELYSSPLIHSDITSFLTGGEKAETKRLRADVKRAVKRGESLSVMCGIKFLGKNKYFGRNDYLKHKFGMMHLTPLKDRDGGSVAFVAVFG